MATTKVEAPPLGPTLAARPVLGEKPAVSIPTRRAADVAVACLLLALGGVVIGASVDMGIGWGSDGPESGFVPFWLAIVLVLSSATILYRSVRRGARQPFATRDGLVCVLKVLLPATAMIALVPFAGLYAASLVYMVGYMRRMGRHSWALSLGLPVAFVVVAFLVFERWFLVPMPKGPIEAWLGY